MHVLLIFLGLLVPITAPAANFRALLIGINYKGADPTIPPLHGAVQDTNAVHALMTGALNIPAATIHTLIEHEASRQAILNEMQQWLIAGTKPGDKVFIAFSGHGVQIPTGKVQIHDPDKKATTPTQLTVAEALVPYDTKFDLRNGQITNLILDTEVHQLLAQLQDRHVTLWLDNCHSGGATRELDIVSKRFQAREVVLSSNWESQKIKVVIPKGPKKAKVMPSGGSNTRPGISSLPGYRFFAATRHFQKAYEVNGRGMFTQALTQLLQANPRAMYTNSQVVTAVRAFLQNHYQMPTSSQEPVFYGPKNAESEVFPLLGYEVVEDNNAIPTQDHDEIPKEETPPTLLRIAITGKGKLYQAVKTAIGKRANQLQLDSMQPDLVVAVRKRKVDLYHPTGYRLRRLPANTKKVLQALLTYRTKQGLRGIQNLAAPFQVELWSKPETAPAVADPPGQSRFLRDDCITLYYRVKELPEPATTAYLTLLNVDPTGTLTVIYPQPQRASTVPGSQRLYLSAKVAPGRVHSIPRGQEALDPGENIGEDLRICLKQRGSEYFKAIVTPIPLDPGAIDEGIMTRGLTVENGPGFAARLEANLQAMVKNLATNAWGAGDLQVVVD